jgi:purine-binding chemotaxis protein CheW
MQAIIQHNRQATGKDEVSNRQYVTFAIADELYGIDVARAQEVLNLTSITRVPNTMSFMKGVIDLRGKIVPLVDMRIRFGIPERIYDHNTVIIIADVRGLICGLIVDSVCDVITMNLDEIQNTPHFASEIEKDSVTGIGRSGGKLVIVLDVDRVLTEEEIHQIRDSN